MKLTSLFLKLLCLSSSAFGQVRLVEGGLYSTQDKNGYYSVLKILKLDPHGVHVRMYSNQFAQHPSKLDETTLYMVGMDRKSNESLGMALLHKEKGRRNNPNPRRNYPTGTV
jgi:hypothetical protein